MMTNSERLDACCGNEPPAAPPKDRPFIAICDGKYYGMSVAYTCTAMWKKSRVFEKGGYFGDIARDSMLPEIVGWKEL